MSTLLATATHVERTDDPAVMRWVCHRDDLDASVDGLRMPPAESPLGALVHGGLITAVELRGGDLLVRIPDEGDWPLLVTEVHEAVLAELTSARTWLTAASNHNAVSTGTAGPSAPGEAVGTPGEAGLACGSEPQVLGAPCSGCHVRSSCATGTRNPSRLRQLLLGDRRN